MKPPPPELDHSAPFTELFTYQELHEVCWDVSFKYGAQRCRIRGPYDTINAQYLKNVKYKELMDFQWTHGFLESRRVKV